MKKGQGNGITRNTKKYTRGLNDKSLDKQKIQALNKEKIKTGTKCLRRQFRHHTGLSSFEKTSNTLTEHFRNTGLGNYPESIEEVVIILVFGTDYPNRVKL